MLIGGGNRLKRNSLTQHFGYGIIKVMKIDFTIEQQNYKAVTALKKIMPDFIAGGVLFNQKVLIACGKIDVKLQSLTMIIQKQFINDNQDFFTGFAWLYYQDWRKLRAKSCANLMDVYNTLNIKFTVNDFVGETFYAGIPKVTSVEINTAIDKYDTNVNINGFAQEKIGIDGKLHPCDAYGEFFEVIDFNDMYADGTMVTKQEIDNYTGR